MLFRPEQLHDIETLHTVEREAFRREAEADLVDRIRASGGITLSLVAVDDDEIVGHVLFSPVTIRSERGEFQALGMGPMAVRPDRHCEFNPPPGCFMVLEMRAGALAGRTGTVYYLPEFQNVG